MVQRKFLLINAVFGLTCLLFTACGDPIPLHGTWSDNFGNSITFFPDTTFTVKLELNTGEKDYEGNFTILMNSITFDCTSETLTIVTEWDIRGNMLYLDWTFSKDEDPKKLTLYKIAN